MINLNVIVIELSKEERQYRVEAEGWRDRWLKAEWDNPKRDYYHRKYIECKTVCNELVDVINNRQNGL